MRAAHRPLPAAGLHPGVSTPFGLLILFIGIGITLNRVPWLPAVLMERRFAAEHIKPALHRGGSAARIDRLIRPRLLILTGSYAINRCNGLLIMLAALLLMLPLAPFLHQRHARLGQSCCWPSACCSGTVSSSPLGYALVSATLVWFSALAIGLLMAGQNISTLFG